MKKRERTGSGNWKKSADIVSVLSKKAVGQLKGTKLENPIRSVGMKLFLLIFCSILACVLCLGWFSYSKSSSIIKQKVADATSQTTGQTAGKVNLLLDGYEKQSMQFIADSEFMSLLNTLTITKDDYEVLDTSRKLIKKLDGVVLADFNYESISLVPIDPNKRIMTSGSSLLRDEIMKSPYIQAMDVGNGKPVWIPTQAKGIDGTRKFPTFAIGRKLPSDFYLILEIKATNALKEQLETVDLGEGSSTYIVSDEGTIIYGPSAEQWGSKYPYNVPGESSETINFGGTDNLSSAGVIKINNWKLIGNIPVSLMVKDAKAISNLTWLMSLLAALIAGGIGLIVMLTVGRPLAQLRTLMNEGEKGNLAVRSPIRKKDEIGQLSDSFNRMMEEITGLVRKTTESAQEVLETAASLTDSSRKTAGAAKEIAIATEEIANGATNLAFESEKGTDLTIKIGSQVQSVIASNVQMGQSANEVEEASRKGSEYMSMLIKKTGQTEDMTRSMVDKVDKLKDSTRSIRKILDVLGNMTKQTNILSLNATIEAARAGNAGKGFMVVADEIRKLADQSRQSISVVGEIVEKIQREIDETVSVLSEAYPIFQEQIESVREANQIFYVVQDNMTGFVHRLESATDSVRHLENAQSTLSLAMSNVSAVAQEASATSEQVASLSSEQLNISDGLVLLSNRLESVSGKLRESLSRFTVR
jgi:methyl-accepting chemotaxis protein